jgi:hypothetical protein
MKGALVFAVLGILAAPPQEGPRDGDAIPIPAGSVLRAAAERDAPALAFIDETALLAPLEKRGEWVKVRWESWVGWVRVAGGSEEPPEWDEPEAWSPPAPRRAQREALVKKLREILGPAGEPKPFGSYVSNPGSPRAYLRRAFTLATDVEDKALLRRLSGACVSVARARVALGALPPSSATIALFSRREDAAAFLTEAEEGWREGVVALWAGAPDLLQRIAHDLAHALNRSHPFVQANGIPGWLDEGIAELVVTGSLRALCESASAESVPLAALVEEPVTCRGPAARRARAAMLVRYLAYRRGSATGNGWTRRVFLGEDSSYGSLLHAFGGDAATLERDFAAWLSRQ